MSAAAANWFLRRLEASVRRAPERTAVVAGSVRLSLRDLDERIAVLAGLLRAAGLGEGARIGVHLENHAGFVVAWWAAWRVGAVAVPLSPRLRPGKWAWLVADAGLDAVISQAGLDAAWRDGTGVPAAVTDAGRLERRGEGGVGGGDGSDGGNDDGSGDSSGAGGNDRGSGAPGSVVPWGVGPGMAPEVERLLRLFVVDESGRLTVILDHRARGSQPPGQPPAEVAAILYTSGSTGVPKGVMHTLASMRAACRMVLPSLDLRADDVILCALPLGFSYGLYQVLMAGVLGATLVLERGMSFPAQLLKVLEREQATVLPAVPTLVATLLGTRLPLARQLASLRVITTAGAPLPAAHLAALRELCPQARLHPMYGLTECKRVSILPAGADVSHAASVGRGLRGQRHWLIDEGGQVLPAEADRVGELAVAGPHLMLGYWRRPTETAATLRPGAAHGLPDTTLLFTGDLFRERPGGWLEFVARRDDLIKCGGEKVSPREVEEVLHALPGVLEAQVLGVPDAIQGARVQARIVRRADAVGAALDERAVIRHCMARLEAPAVPRDIVFVEALPRQDSGKAARHVAMPSITPLPPIPPNPSR